MNIAFFLQSSRHPAARAARACKGESMPEPRNVREEMMGEIQARVQAQPSIYAAEEEYRPKYTKLELEQLQQYLLGGSDQSGMIALLGQARDMMAGPNQNKILDLLNQQALEELSAGASLDPGLRRETAQAVRAAQAARGFGYSPRDVAEEAYLTASQAEQLRRNRQAFGQNVSALNESAYTAPVLSLLGNPTAAASSIGPKLFGSTTDVNDINSTNYNAAVSAYNASRNNAASLASAGISGGTSLAGAGILAVAL